jgi:anti-anti-sigma regulatory factor
MSGRGDGRTSKSSSIELSASLDISAVERLYTQLKESIEKGEDITLDASQVTRVSTPAIQILISAYGTCHKAGTSFQIKNFNEAILQDLIDLGLGSTEFHKCIIRGE